MKHLLFGLSLLALSACSTTAQESASPCIALKLDCTGSGNILVVGKAEEQSDLLNTALSASKKFKDTFNRPPAKTVIVPGGVISQAQRTAFEAAGYPVSLPWVSAADKAKLQETSIRRQVAEQTKDLPEAVQKMALEQALAAVGSGASDKNANEVQAGAFAHELGHLWFIQAFKPEGEAAQTGHAYGGWAPDWLDETAAVLLENPALIAKRRAAFKALSPTEIIPLREFLTMEHPAAKSAQDLRDALPDSKEEGESRAIVLTGKEAEEFLKKSGGNKAANFYAQAQVFSDFLLSNSGDKALYVSLTEDLLAGNTFEDWLSDKGATWKLPTTLSGLETAWRDWIQTKG